MAPSTFGGTMLINGPVPQPPRFNLLSVARPATSPDDDDVIERFAMGAEVWPYLPDQPSGNDPCDTGSLRTKGTGTAPTISKFGAFTGYIAETCSAVSIGSNPQAYADRAVASFAGMEYLLLERQLMSGTYKPDNYWLADLNVTLPLGATAVDAVAGLEELERQIGLTGRAGVIHADPQTIIRWSKDWVVFREGTQLVTDNGTPVVSGYGYIGAHPVAQPAQTATSRKSWAFATGPILYRRGPEIIQLPYDVREALNRGDNSITYRAERDYLVVWDRQLQAAVLIDRSL